MASYWIASPMLVSYAGSAHHHQALSAASVENQLAQGNQNASLTNYCTIRDNKKL
jgi:hypothetical protein